MARMVSTEVWDTVNSVIGCLNFRWCCDQHIHGLEHLITCLWAAIELVYLWMEPGGTSLVPSPRYPAENSFPQTHFEENDIFCLDKKTFNGKRNVFCVFTKKPLRVVWNGEMIRKYELSVPCLTGHTPRLTFQRFPQFNTKLRLYVHLQSSFVSINTATLYYSISNTFLMYISTMALGQHTTRTSRSAMLGGNSFS